jgi:PBSX family phage portal protein
MSAQGPLSPIEEARARAGTVRVKVISSRRRRPRQSIGQPNAEAQPPQALNEESKGAGLPYLTPPFSPSKLAERPQNSTIIPQCVRARAGNIEGYGHTFIPLFEKNKVDEAFLAAAEEERQRAARFFAFCCSEMTFRELLRRTRIDMDSVGYGGWEFLRTRSTAELGGFEHVKGKTLRKAPQGDEYVPVLRRVLDLDGSQWLEQVVWRRLRLYVQVGRNNQRTFFKEPGDPRKIMAATGEILRNEDGTFQLMDKADYADPELAHELLWFEEYDPAEVYGLPPWIGTAICDDGSRYADEANWLYFENRGMPPIVISVCGGTVTPESLKRLKEKLEGHKSIEHFHDPLIIEAIPMDLAASAEGILGDTVGAKMTPRIEIKPIIDYMKGDALFQTYDHNNRTKVRSACGLPPVFVGESQDYSFATARVSLEVAERSTFGPARQLVAEMINLFVMPELQILWWKFGFKGPKLSNAEDIKALIEAGVAANVGAPNDYAPVISDGLGIEIPQRDEPYLAVPPRILEQAVASGGAVIQLEGVETQGFESDEEAMRAIYDVVERAFNHRDIRG